MIRLEPAFLYRVTTTDPLPATEGSPAGPRIHWQVSAAELDGPEIKARLAGTGGDWMAVGPDGFWRPDVRAQFLTDDGAVVLMHYTGLVEQTNAFKAAAEADRPTDWEDQYLRVAIRFETGAERYRWLNQRLFVAAGRLLGTGRIEYQVYRVD
jgi:hypothetical protein